MLIETFTCSMASGRLQLPGELGLRGEELVITRSFARCLAAYERTEWKKLEGQLLALPLSNENWKRLYLGYALDCQTDARGRLHVPQELRAASGLATSGRAVVMSAGDQLSIWEPSKLRGAIDRALFSRDPARALDAPHNAPFHLPGLQRSLAEAVERRAYREIERIVATALAQIESSIVELTQFSKDDGIDIVVHTLDRSTNASSVIYVQCKGGDRPAAVREVRELIGVAARDGVHSTILFSAAGFTGPANREASESLLRVQTVDVPLLFEFVRKHQSVESRLMAVFEDLQL